MCHSDPSYATNGVPTGGNRTYLGPATGSVDATVVLSGMVGKPSFEAPSMNVITAGDPTKSYLMFKMDGPQQLMTLASACQSGDLGTCGLTMPFGVSMPLPQATRDLVRSWITQGAKNN